MDDTTNEPGPQPAREGSARRSPRWAAAVLAAIVAVLVGGYLVASPDGDASAPADTAADVPDFVVFLEPDHAPSDKDVVQQNLVRHPAVEHVDYVSQPAALTEYRCLFADRPDVLDDITDPGQLPPSYHVHLFPAQRESAGRLRSEIAAMPTVRAVVEARAAVLTGTTEPGPLGNPAVRFGPHDTCGRSANALRIK